VPKYLYECEKCKHQFDILHSIKERLVDCDECGTKETLKRIPFVPMLNKRTEPRPSASKPGAIVNQYIEETKEEVRLEKERLKKESKKQ